MSSDFVHHKKKKKKGWKYSVVKTDFSDIVPVAS